MSNNFYGGVLKCLEKAFNVFAFQNSDKKFESILPAKNTKDGLIFSAKDRWIQFKAGKEQSILNQTENAQTIEILHTLPDDSKSLENTADINITNSDISHDANEKEPSGIIITNTYSLYDERGHRNTKTEDKKISLNINTEISRAKDKENSLQKQLDNEVSRSQEIDFEHQEAIETLNGVDDTEGRPDDTGKSVRVIAEEVRNELKGQVSESHNTLEKIEKTILATDNNVSEINKQVSENTESINTLNGNPQLYGSVKYWINQAVLGIIDIEQCITLKHEITPEGVLKLTFLDKSKENA